ncbi:MAG: hypothetical protein ACTHOF_00925 [Flavisolibacter sp.]|jgi:hypothetical protein
MKNTIFLFLAAFLVTASVNAQSTADSIAAKYKLQPMPEALTLEKAFPVIGTYHLSNTTDTTSVITVSLDSSNKGIVWVEGLPQGKFKAYLKQSPASYRILAQKTESGTQVPEGTLIFDPSTNTLNVELGKAYDDANPSEVFAMNTGTTESTDVTDAGTEVKVKTKTKNSKVKNKIVFYSAVKAVQNTSLTGAVQQEQQ